VFDLSSMEAVEKPEETIPGVRFMFPLNDFPQAGLGLYCSNA